jgi:RNA polymerase sigma factor (sigma-70 family)
MATVVGVSREPIREASETCTAAQQRFSTVFGHLGMIVAYARRRGAGDPEGIAAEAMTIAWRRLGDVPVDDARPWLIATARNLLLAERRKSARANATLDGIDIAVEDASPLIDLDPELEAALRRLSELEREALLLVAWEDLSATAAAASLGISRAAFRVRLHRARRRLSIELRRREHRSAPQAAYPVEES